MRVRERERGMQMQKAVWAWGVSKRRRIKALTRTTEDNLAMEWVSEWVPRLGQRWVWIWDKEEVKWKYKELLEVCKCTLQQSKFLSERLRETRRPPRIDCATSEVLALKHESRIIWHFWDVSKVSTVFLSGLGALPVLLFSAQIMAWKWETRNETFLRILAISENPILVLTSNYLCATSRHHTNRLSPHSQDQFLFGSVFRSAAAAAIFYARIDFLSFG